MTQEEKEKRDAIIESAPFGWCPFCLTPMVWDSDGCMADRTGVDEDEDVSIIYTSCPHCGASAEIIGCLNKEKKNYPFWNNKTEEKKVYEDEPCDFHLTVWESILVAVVYLSALSLIGGFVYLTYLAIKS